MREQRLCSLHITGRKSPELNPSARAHEQLYLNEQISSCRCPYRFFFRVFIHVCKDGTRHRDLYEISASTVEVTVLNVSVLRTCEVTEGMSRLLVYKGQVMLFH